MPSQEDYLDNLLKDLNGNITDSEQILEKIEEEEQPENDNSDDMDDIMRMLSQTDDSELQEIHDLLQKSDNHENIVDDMDITEYNEAESGREDEPEGTVSEETEDLRAVIAAENKAKREAVKAEKAKQREEIKAEKKAKRAAAKAEKEAKRAAKKALKETEEAAEEETVEEETVEAVQEVIPEIAEDSDSFFQAMEDSADLSALFAGVDGVSNVEEGEKEIFEMPELDAIAGESKEKTKKSFFARMIDFFTEEAEEEEKEEIKLSEENRDILQEMDKEKGKKKSKKKKGKSKDAEASVEGEEASKEAKKEKKAKKPKKEKTPKLETVVEQPQKKLSKKKVILIMLVCLSIGFAVIVVANVFGNFASKREARVAYYQGDYQTCYQNLFGKELNESEQVMYSKSESILRIRLWLREYELFAEEGKTVEALDSLIQSVHDYPVLYSYSEQWNAENEVAESYAKILNILSENYHLTEAQAREISELPDDVEYTMAVTALSQGVSYENWRYGGDETEEELPDILPEEDELSEDDFVDNMEIVNDGN